MAYTRQDLQFRVWQEKDSYGARSAFFEIVLNDATDGHCFSCKGNEFQHAGTMLFIERLSERVTKKLFLAPRVLWPWSTFSKKEDISLGSRFLCSLKENTLMLCSNNSSILRMLLLKNKGSAWEIRWALLIMRTKYWATRSSVRLFACTAHSFACYALLDSLARFSALTRSRARGRVWYLTSHNQAVLNHSGVAQ